MLAASLLTLRPVALGRPEGERVARMRGQRAAALGVIGLGASMRADEDLAQPEPTPSRRPDELLEIELMRRVAAGDRTAAMRDLVEIYSGRLYGLGRRLLGDRGMAEELAQDTMVRVWRSAARFDPERGSVKTFVFTLARRAAIDLQRRSSARPLDVGGEGSAESAAEGASNASEYLRLIDRLELRDAMRGLSGEHRTVLELSFDEDLAQPQIAERLGVPLGTVKSRVHHALRSLRAELERRGVALDPT